MQPQHERSRSNAICHCVIIHTTELPAKGTGPPMVLGGRKWIAIELRMSVSSGATALGLFALEPLVATAEAGACMTKVK